ncbi:MAG: lipoate-protein ligase A [Candidatus Nanohaloarchaea archaeon]|jgi:lipoate-protein ligase A
MENNQTWRFISFERHDPYFKTGLNKALMESVRNGSNPIIFLAGWDRKCINLGYSQSFEEEVDVEEFEKRDDVILVRRQGGGGATFLTPEGEITWGIVASEKNFPDDVNEIYEDVCGKIAEGLEKIGINAEHEPINDIVTGNGKISGATLKREDGVVYIGGTLIYQTDPEEMFSLLTPSEDKLKDKQIKEFRERVSSITQESDASFDEARKILKKALTEERKFQESELTDSELKRSQELADKYSEEEWLYRE